MDKNKKKNKDLKNAQFRNGSELKNHNEKRKAQDSGNQELKDTQKFDKFN
jgi:hypothetical protein